VIDGKDNILTFGTPTGTIEIHPQPEEIIDVDPEILAVMGAKLRGESLDNIYDKGDRITQDLLIRKESEKLRRIFSDRSQVFEAFSSLSNLKAIRRELQFENVNRGLLAEYSFKKFGGVFIDEADVYASFFNDTAPLTKSQRANLNVLSIMRESSLEPIFVALKEPYLANHIEPLGVSKELLQLQPTLLAAFKAGYLVERLNALLRLFYQELL
jgi:hypothetical protein